MDLIARDWCDSPRPVTRPARSTGCRHRRRPFVALQSSFGRHLAANQGISVEQPETFVAVIDGAALLRCGAALGIAAGLAGLRWMRAFAATVARRSLQSGGTQSLPLVRSYDRCDLSPPGLRVRVIEGIAATLR